MSSDQYQSQPGGEKKETSDLSSISSSTGEQNQQASKNHPSPARSSSLGPSTSHHNSGTASSTSTSTSTSTERGRMGFAMKSEVNDIPEESSDDQSTPLEPPPSQLNSAKRNSLTSTTNQMTDRPQTPTPKHLQPPPSAFRPRPDSRNRYTTPNIPRSAQGYGSLGSNNSSLGQRRAGSRVPSRSVSRVRGSEVGSETEGTEDDEEMTRDDPPLTGRITRNVSYAGTKRGQNPNPSSTMNQKEKEREREKRDKGEELIRQRQIERRKAKRLASSRAVSYYPSATGTGEEYNNQNQNQNQNGQGQQEDVFQTTMGEMGYSVPTTPMFRHTQTMDRQSNSGRKRYAPPSGEQQEVGGYFPPYTSSVSGAGSTVGDGESVKGSETGSDAVTPMPGDTFPYPQQHAHTAQPTYDNKSQHQQGRQRSLSRTNTNTLGRTPRLNPSTPGFGHGGYGNSPVHTPGIYNDQQGVGKAASVIEQVVSELGDLDRGDMGGDGDEEEEGDDDDDDDDEEVDEEGVTMRDRQDAINIEHPFGLPIWKPALYKKSRSITRNAEVALHAIPSAAAERHLLPGNLLWTLVFGWWLALMCFAIAGVVLVGETIGGLGWRGKRAGGYARTVAGLGWYIGWPFGKYVEGKGFKRKKDDVDDEEQALETVDEVEPETEREENEQEDRRVASQASSSSGTTVKAPRASTVGFRSRENSVASIDAWKPSPAELVTETAPLVPKTKTGDKGHVSHVDFAKGTNGQARNSLYGAIGYSNGDSKRHPDDTRGTKFNGGNGQPHSRTARIVGGFFYWPLFVLFIAPTLSAVCLLCWGMVVTIPMAKLTWALLRYLARGPLDIKFRAAPKIAVVVPPSPSSSPTFESDPAESSYTFRRARLSPGQLAPTGGPESTVLLCTYRAIGLQYYKYTVGGVNIMFVNLLPLVFFTILDGLVILPRVEHGHTSNPIVKIIASPALIFLLSLASVIPLSYFIGMAVASISAQSSIGMGAVINATFGSVIEVILYSIALTQGKGKLVEGSIVGSILAGVLLMPGGSMISGAFKRKEQKFNAKSAGVTSTMLIMAIIGTLTPTLFYQTYGSFQLRCEGCPGVPGGTIIGTLPHNASIQADMRLYNTFKPEEGPMPWQCDQCYYDHPDPATDPFYQEQVKGLMYFCAIILVFSYLVGLWFSLRTHASQIWQNPQQLMKVDEVPVGSLHPAVRASIYQKLTPQAIMHQILPLNRSAEHSRNGTAQLAHERERSNSPGFRSLPTTAKPGDGAAKHKRQDSLNSTNPVGYTPNMEAQHIVNKDGSMTPMKLPNSLTPEDFTRAVAAATVSALRQHAHAAGKKAGHMNQMEAAGEEEEHGGHEGPSWSRAVSAAVLLVCTVLYAAIAEILVDVIDVVLEGSGIDEKFLGLTLFALVPNTTEFMNAFSFALNGNIALSMEIGSAYALQVCLLQIPAMVAFSAFYDPGKLGDMVDTFTLIFPRWDVIAIVLSIFLLTYTYIEARSNYHRGSILVLAYLVLTAGFYFAPSNGGGEEAIPIVYGPYTPRQPLNALPTF